MTVEQVTQTLAGMTDKDLLALCVWRESRGESYLAKLGVAYVIRNRASQSKWWGKSIREVILKPYQFSSFNNNDVNFDKFPDTYDPSFIECSNVATHALEGTEPDPTSNSTFYFDKSLDAKPPKWAESYVHTIDIGRLHFYRES